MPRDGLESEEPRRERDANSAGGSEHAAEKPAAEKPAAEAHREAFARLFAQHDRWLFSYLVVLLGNPADAEEVFQEVCVVLWRENETFRMGTDFVRWASVIAHNQVHRFRARRKRSRRQLGDEALDRVADVAAGRADLFEHRRDALRNCLTKLSDQDRKVIRHCYDDEAGSFKAAAEQLGRPVNTVYKALNRIRRVLHECIERTLSAEGWI